MPTTPIFRLVLPLLLITSLLTACRKDATTSSCDGLLPLSIGVPCTADATALQALSRDAKQLALRDIRDQGAALADSIVLPDAIWMPYAKALWDVRTAIPEVGCTDLSALLEIHPFRRVAMDEILLEVDTTYAWVQAWLNGISLTGNAQVDALMGRYALEAVEVYDWSWGWHVAVRAVEPLNLPPLIEQFVAIDGVVDGFENGRVGDGDDIRMQSNGTSRVIQVYRSYGDCPSGCIYDDIWTFRTSEEANECRVVYEGFVPGQ